MGKISQWLSQSYQKSISPISSATRVSGNLFEDLAKKHLTQQGLLLVESQYECRLGEIDLIMTEGEVLVFVEVRYRKSDHYGCAAATVDKRKQQKIIKTAKYFLQAHKAYLCFDCRFDVIAVSESHDEPSINWIKNAFSEGFH